MKSVAIVGGGATGVVAALHLLEVGGARVSVFEPSAELGGGLAYSGRVEEHLLNVPADRMGWTQSDPADFLTWLMAERPETLASRHFPYVPRFLFRLYLNSRLGGRATHICERVSCIQAVRGGFRLDTDNASGFFDACIVATGYRRESESPPLKIPAVGDVAILGAGLSAIDHWRLLRSKGFRGRVHFVSRRGLFPLSHATYLMPPLSDLRGLSPRRILRELRLSGGEWPALADHVRALAPSVWREWNERERESFVRHLKPYWEIARHRLPATVHAELQAELNSNRVQLHRGRMKAWDGSTLDLLTRDGPKTIAAKALLHATGVHVNTDGVKIIGHRPSRFGYGENPAPGLYVAGPASRAEHWEITAIPEIRVQCARIAECITTASDAALVQFSAAT